MIAACGGSEELSGDDFPEGDSGSSTVIFDDGGTSFIVDASFFDDGGVSIADAGFGGDGGRRHRDGGIGGFDGGFSFDGGVGVSDSGTILPPPPLDGGPQGPRDAGTLSGPLLHDANGVVLGEIVSIQEEGAYYTIITSTDYVVDINFDGSFLAQAFLFSAPNCGGTPYLTGAGESGELLGNTVVYSTTLGSLLIPSGPLSNGAQASVPVSWASEGDPCMNGAGTGLFGWSLVETSAANVGLPDTITAPLTYP